MDKVTTVGIDLAKRVFALHGVDALRNAGPFRQLQRFVGQQYDHPRGASTIAE